MKIANLAQRGGGVGINMTPMIDVVFQLLIFFLVSSHLAKQEGQLPLPLPSATTGERPDEASTGRRVTLNIQSDGLLLLAGRPTTESELPARLSRLRDEQGPSVELRLRVDRRAAYAAVEPVLAACAEVGVWNVAFAVVRGAADSSP